MRTLEIVITEETWFANKYNFSTSKPLLHECRSNNSVTRICFHDKKQIPLENLLSIKFNIFILKTEHKVIYLVCKDIYMLNS